MNLFENLQLIKESEALTERKELSVSEYNKLKIALNKNNVMKANFILHPGSIKEYDYKLVMSIYGAFRNFEKSRQSIHVYDRNTTNDQATKLGVGVRLYDVTINLIDEAIDFTDTRYTYDIERYVDRYNDQLIKDGLIKDSEMDFKSLVNAIVDVANKSKADLESALRSKNFIYNLTGKKKINYDSSKEYNLDLENTMLTEDFDPSMPNWLMRAIKANNANKSRGHKDLNYDLPFDTMKWTVKPFPEKGKLDTIGDNAYIALLIDKSGDNHRGEYIVYFPAAYIGSDETITINGRNRYIRSMSLKALAPYVKEYALSVASTGSKTNVRQKQADRNDSKSGSIDRIGKEDRPYYAYVDTYDKSGYIVDPNKYKRLLAQMKSDKYAERLEDLYVVLSDLRSKLRDYMSQDDVIPDPKQDRYASKRASMNTVNSAYKYYDEAIRYYQYATEELDKIASGSKGRFGGEAIDGFTKYLSTSEINIVNCLEIIEK